MPQPAPREGLLIHHWDTDGVCSAALLLRHLYTGFQNWTPTIGAFYLSPKQIEWARQFSAIVVADMALPEENIAELAESSKVTVYDHHHQEPLEGVEHINPVAHGADPEGYPSCTWVVKEHLSLPASLHVVLGFVGDREQKIKESPAFWEYTRRFLTENGLSFEQLHIMVQLIDSCHKVGDREAVMEAARLLQVREDPETIMGNLHWRRNLEVFEGELQKILSDPPHERDGVLYMRLDTRFSVISAVTRSIAWGTGRDAVVVNRGFFEDEDQVYSRSGRLDMQPMIDRARVKGFNAGGKKDVLGAIVPKGETTAFVEELIKYLKN